MMVPRRVPGRAAWFCAPGSAGVPPACRPAGAGRSGPGRAAPWGSRAGRRDTGRAGRPRSQAPRQIMPHTPPRVQACQITGQVVYCSQVPPKGGSSPPVGTAAGSPAVAIGQPGVPQGTAGRAGNVLPPPQLAAGPWGSNPPGESPRFSAWGRGSVGPRPFVDSAPPFRLRRRIESRPLQPSGVPIPTVHRESGHEGRPTGRNRLRVHPEALPRRSRRRVPFYEQ
jgi:hypothetical protein